MAQPLDTVTATPDQTSSASARLKRATLYEYLLIAGLIAASLVPLVAAASRAVAPRGLVTISVAAMWLIFPLAIIGAALVYRRPVELVEQATYRPIEVESDGYVGSDSCQSCHPHHHATWQDSFHRTMTQIATPGTMLASLDAPPVKAERVTFQLRAEDDAVWADMEMPAPGSDASTSLRVSRRIVMTTGSHHMQVLWYPYSNDNRLLGMFPFVYLKEQERWIPRGAAFLQPGYSLEDELGRWNQTCIVCHATFGRMRPQQGIDPETGQAVLDANSLDSQVAEFGISCEACHGPGERHVLANQSPARRYRQHVLTTGDPTIVNPAKLSHERKSQVCGQCHSVQCTEATYDSVMNGLSYRPGEDLAESKDRFVFRVRDGLQPREQKFLEDNPDFIVDHYWADGMVRISGREYNGLIESPCYQRGEMSCLSCHQMHQDVHDSRGVAQWADDQLHPGMENPQACVNCHQQFRSVQSLAEHTHHDAASAGSNCYNCHMPHSTYGLLKAIRGHEIDSPSVQASLATGRPNACNQCHLDKTLAWTAQQLAAWYGTASPELSADERNIAASVLWLLRGDAGQRALMAWSYGWSDAQRASGTHWMAPYLAQLLNDPYAAVRMIAGRSLQTLPGFETLRYDFVGSSNERAAIQARALEAWAAVPHHAQEDVLIDEQGQLLRTEFQRLLGQRDDRPITLVE